MKEDNLCPVCNVNSPEEANFCYNCGEPLSAEATTLLQKQKTNAKLELLIQLINVVEDPKTLNRIKSLVNELSKQ